VEHCRVLELGCGAGNNLIAMAHSFPESTFLGVDLAGRPMEQGRRLIAGLGLNNIRLERMDLCDFPENSGEFDYIIAHGLYSWIPDEVRTRTLAICRTHLRPDGVAFISYNAYPGCHLREITRGIMAYHVRQLADPREKVKQGRALIKFLGESIPESNLWQNILKDQSTRISNYSDNGLFHDDLSPICKAFYFHEFMEQAERQGLQFLAESEFHTMKPLGLTDAMMGLLAQLEKSSLVMKEQYLDFLRGRGFRQTLLCHQSATLSRDVHPERAFDLHVAADTARVEATDNPEDFQSKWGTIIGTTHPVARAAMTHLGRIWPRSVHFAELLQLAQDDAAKQTQPRARTEEDRSDLGEFLIRCHQIGVVELHLHPWPFVTEVSQQPTASPLARVQLRHGNTVSNLRHQPVQLIDNLGQCLVQLLNGTRDRPMLIAELELAVRNRAVTVYRDGKPIEDLKEAMKVVETELDANLAGMASMALLVS